MCSVVQGIVQRSQFLHLVYIGPPNLFQQSFDLEISIIHCSCYLDTNKVASLF